MQVNVIPSMPGVDAFRALVYSPPTPDMINYMQSTMQRAGQTLGELGTGFIQRAGEVFSALNSYEAIERGKRLLSMVGTHVDENVIYTVPFERLHQANLEMQRYIMSEPSIRNMYNQQSISGYEDTYYNNDVEIVDGLTTRYMDVMTGVGYYDPYKPVDPVFYTHSHDVYFDLDRLDRMSVLDTWRNVRNAIAKGIDPTSKHLDEL